MVSLLFSEHEGEKGLPGLGVCCVSAAGIFPVCDDEKGGFW